MNVIRSHGKTNKDITHMIAHGSIVTSGPLPIMEDDRCSSTVRKMTASVQRYNLRKEVSFMLSESLLNLVGSELPLFPRRGSDLMRWKAARVWTRFLLLMAALLAVYALAAPPSTRRRRR